MIELPKDLEQSFLQTTYAIEQDKKMPYTNTAERMGMEPGFQEGHQQGQHLGIEGTLRNLMKLIFGERPAWANERLTQADDAQLDVWVARILTTDYLEDLLAEL